MEPPPTVAPNSDPLTHGQELKGETGGGANFEGFISLSVAVRAVSGGRGNRRYCISVIIIP